jgi:sugar/nucleoside kinase (ribokinase family)
MSHTIDVIVYGTVCLDLLWSVDELPPPGGYVEILQEKKAIGGEAANSAVALARWGAKTALVGNPIGNDLDGQLLAKLFSRDVPELSLEHLRFIDSVQTPYCVCISSRDGQRTMFGHRFADLACTPLDEKLAGSATWFTVEPNAYACGIAAAEMAAAGGARVIAMDYAREPRMNQIASIILTSSEHVGRAMPVEALAEFAKEVRDTYDKPVIVTLGDRGCILAKPSHDGGGLVHYPAYTAPRVVDSTGSGDVFRAGLLFGLLRGETLDDAIRFGSAAASLNCTEMGGWGGVKSVEEVDHHRKTAPTNAFEAV